MWTSVLLSFPLEVVWELDSWHLFLCGPLQALSKRPEGAAKKAGRAELAGFRYESCGGMRVGVLLDEAGGSDLRSQNRFFQVVLQTFPDRFSMKLPFGLLRPALERAAKPPRR